MKQLDVILEAAEPVVTKRTKECPYFAGVVIVVYCQIVALIGSGIDGHFSASANGAGTFLVDDHLVVLGRSDPVLSLDACAASTLFADPLDPQVSLGSLARLAPSVPSVTVEFRPSEPEFLKGKELATFRAVFAGLDFIAKKICRMTVHLTSSQVGCQGTAGDNSACPFALISL
jgi:hypothetical protein